MDSQRLAARRTQQPLLAAGCRITAAGRTSVGWLLDIRQEMIRLQLDPVQSLSRWLEKGLRAQVSLTLPGQDDPVSVEGEVVSLDGSSTDPGWPGVETMVQLAVDPAHPALAELNRLLPDLKPTVLVVHSDPAVVSRVSAAFEGGCRVLTATSVAEAVRLAKAGEPRVLVVPDELEGRPCAGVLPRLIEALRTPVIALVVLYRLDVSAQLDELVQLATSVSCLRLPFRPHDLRQSIRRGLEVVTLATENLRLRSELERANRRLQRENQYLRQRREICQSFEHIVGASPPLRSVLGELDQVRTTDASVHLHGETGTGKELIAKALHFGGSRSAGPLVIFNCASVTESLLHSTLFGHRRGAFTGAERDQPGIFEQAHKGTLVLDEVSELSPSAQAALLRVLQEGELTPLGASRPLAVDVRLISVSQKSLNDEVRAGRFREDLYFRLVVVSMRVPSLREREGDVPLLVQHLLKLHCSRAGKAVPEVAPDALQALQAHPWPGNIRELENEVSRLALLSEEGQPVTRELLSHHVLNGAGGAARGVASGEALFIPRDRTYDEAMALLSGMLIDRALERSAGAIAGAARLLGVERSRLSKLRSRLAGAGQ
jgi:two-component system response regulator HupR/HoxA